jgi:hypothetical protein
MYGTGTTGGDQEVAKKTHLGFRPLADVVRFASGHPVLLGSWGLELLLTMTS